MLKVFSAFVLAMSLSLSALADIKPGTYKLLGQNPGGSSEYRGTVTITANGPNYHLVWSIGDSGQQQQSGVGILEGNVLSVAYLDGSGQDMGVVSFKVMEDGHLEGKWAPMNSNFYGTEALYPTE